MGVERAMGVKSEQRVSKMLDACHIIIVKVFTSVAV
jgi:hypothetical protein